MGGFQGCPRDKPRNNWRCVKTPPKTPNLKTHKGGLECTATIWASRRTRNPHFVVLGASLLFDNMYLGASFASDMAFLGFHPFSPIFTYFHSQDVVLSRLISPHHGSPQYGHSASTSIDFASCIGCNCQGKDQHADDKRAHEDQPLDKGQLDALRMHGGQMCIVCGLT